MWGPVRFYPTAPVARSLAFIGRERSPHPMLFRACVQGQNVSQQQQQQQQTSSRSAPGPPARSVSPICVGPFDPVEGSGSETDLSETHEESEYGGPHDFASRGIKGEMLDSYDEAALGAGQEEETAAADRSANHPLNRQQPGSFGDFHANGARVTHAHFPPFFPHTGFWFLEPVRHTS